MFLTAIALALPAQTPATGETIPLSLKRHRAWAIELPDERFVPVGDGLELAGRTFAAAREGSGLALDLDADGQTDVEITGDEGAALLRTADGFAYPVRLKRGINGWFYATGGAMVGKRGNTRISILDQDGDGRYGEVGQDAVIVGRGGVASTLGQTLVVDEELFRVAVTSAGDALQLTPYEGATGMIEVADAFDGEGRVLSAVVQSADGTHVLDLAEARGPVPVPVGAWHLQSAKVGLGSMAVAVDRGFSKDMEVTSGEETTLAWGGPVRAEFAFQRQGAKVGFSPDAIWYYGENGERYATWFPVGDSPVFHLQDAETGEEYARAMFPGSG